MVSQQLVEQWRVRLAAWQQRLDEGRPRPWLARAYARVLSYLLAQYAPQANAEATPETEPPPERPSMKFVLAVSELSGKAPRTQTEIRSVLEALQSNVPRAEPGPLVDGLQSDDPIVVAAFYRSALASGLKAMLDRERIDSHSKRFRRQTQVIVRAADLDRAKPIVPNHASAARDSPRWQSEYSGAFLFSLFTVIGAAFGAELGAILGDVVHHGLRVPLVGLVLERSSAFLPGRCVGYWGRDPTVKTAAIHCVNFRCRNSIDASKHHSGNAADRT
jgi:hypothetical protein